MKVGIAGAGGIGSNVAAFLARSGVRRFKIADGDRVDESNLNRQFYFRDQIGLLKVEALAENLLRIAPDADIEIWATRLDADAMAECFQACDLVVEGFDGRNEKKMLLEALAPRGMPVVSASGVAGRALEGITVRRLGAGTIIGDFCTDAGRARCFAPKVALVAAMMAHEVLLKGGYYDHPIHP
jgi:sulfur carrier protein ThiS adenylyltransferase